MNYLALYLRAPLQSWGASGMFEERTTLDHPTRSGVLGMLAAACGIDKHDELREREWLEQMSSLGFKSFGFKVGSRLRDYHTVGGGYNKDNPRERPMIPSTSEGKPKGTSLTKRYYLIDTIFGVILSGDEGILTTLSQALDNPVWGVWFGRKCCIPTEPINAGIHASEADALAALQQRYRRSRPQEAEIETTSQVVTTFETSSSDAHELLRDVPVSYSKREYQGRWIKTEHPKPVK